MGAAAEMVSENWQEDDKINYAYLKMQANEKLISKFIPDMHNDFGDEAPEAFLQEEAQASSKKSIPKWVENEGDLEAFLQEASSAEAPRLLEAAKDKVANMLQEDTQ